MIIATSGHVDHGKTLLVKALTGVDADRLPEEKRRGMTIDIGFAYLPAPAGEARDPIGFIDVPGHERFIHNMLCGVAGIDAALLVIAADDGPMPQTREHLAILDLLEVRSGMVALTKIDRVPPERIDEVRAEIAGVLSGTTLADAPVFPVSAVSGEGVAVLARHLEAVSRTLPARPVRGNFRLAVDRSFSVPGAGLVVTGTVFSGRIATDAAVRALETGMPARARSIHAQNAASSAGRAGQRCALNLAGPEVRADRIRRGEWIVTGEVPPPARKIDARLRVLAGEVRGLRHWSPVHVHLGAEDVTGRIALLEGDSIAPGEAALVQLVLDRPMAAVHGDRFVVRDQSAQRTLGGGRVIDMYSPPRGRARPERIAWLRAMAHDDPALALDALLRCAPGGLDLAKFAANRNLDADEAADLFRRAAMKQVNAGAQALGFLPAQWERLRAAAVERIAALHRRDPAAAGPAPERILDGAGVRISGDVAAAMATELVAAAVLRRSGSGVELATHHRGFAGEEAKLWRRIEAVLEAGRERPPLVAEIVQATGIAQKSVLAVLVRAVRFGFAVRVAENRFFLKGEILRLARIAEAAAESGENGRFTAAVFRDGSALGRNLSIEVLEFFDRVRFTRRVGDARAVLTPASKVFAEQAGNEPPIR